jgi:UDP-N-acetylglucosamine 2-epimerase (non-hydrolysing)
MTGAPLKILFVLGTRPEAIKLAPVFKRLREHPHEFETRLVVTGQHRNLLDQALETFAMVPDYDLDIMRPGQSLFASTSRIIVALESVLIKENPNLVLVQGDTTTTLCGALGAFYRCIPVGHVEAGLRTSDSAQPFPEEMNRKLVARLATLHFASTHAAAENLRREAVEASSIFVTGNTGIDTLIETRDALVAGRIHAPELAALDPQKKMILVTAHRRESFGDGLERICEALATLAARVDVEIIFPIHPNPNVSEIAIRRLGKCKTIKLIEPLAYVSFVDLMNRAHILLTDSGGIQEEGPSLGKPILILREKTERPEAVVAGTARLTGTDPARIVSETALLLDDNTEYLRRSRVDNLFGDGRASARILEIIRSHFAINSAHENRQSVTRS